MLYICTIKIVNMKIENVFSAFDGMSGGQIGLAELGIKYKNYFASEINPDSIKVTQDNFPKTIQLGDIQNIDLSKLPKIDLYIGGSPCQGFSIAGKKLNFEDSQSKLFFEYVRILNEVRKVNHSIKFLLENVRIPDEIANAIDDILGVKRVYLDSRHFSGMIRKRYYWTNLPVQNYSVNVGYVIEDIIDKDIPFDKNMDFFFDRCPYTPTTSSDGIITINPKTNEGKQTWQRGRVYDIKGAMPTICASLFDLNITSDHKTYRKLTINECEKAQGVPRNYTKSVTKNKAEEMLGNV